ncbi:ATP-grasp domain-containing protein [bacterium AH-315-P13]|nr:ATP-grasp domain-containing protein [bacterium AH-315-P13]MBN4047033.1 ATP-grasp domain-containing protein [bacterium AH-315-P13]
MGKNILFTCAGRHNYLINYFKDALNGNGKVFAADQTLLAPALFDADVAITVPNIYDENYISAIKEIILEHKINAVIPLNDFELPILSKHKTELENTGAKVILSNEDIINIAFDKMETFNFIKQIGLKTPKTFTNFKEAKTAIKNGTLKFPLVVKPRWGSASINIDFPETMEELELAFTLQQLKLKKSILNVVSQHDFDNAILIQEKIEGKEFGMSILNDFEGNYVGTFPREKLSMRSGETDRAISVIDPKFETLGKTIAKNLKHIGNLDCDVFIVNNELYVLELNLRFGGGYPFSHEAGINIAAIYIDWLNNIVDVTKHNQYKAGIIFSKCEKLIRILSEN